MVVPRKFGRLVRAGIAPSLAKKIAGKNFGKPGKIQSPQTPKKPAIKSFAKELFEEATLRLKGAKNGQQVYVGSFVFVLGGDRRVRLWVSPKTKQAAEIKLSKEKLGTTAKIDGELFVKTSKGVLHILEANAIGLGPIQEK